MIVVAMVMILVAMALTLLHCLQKGSTYGRVLTANMFGTQTVVLIALFAVVMDEWILLDIAILYALVNFITTVALLKYFKDRSFR